MTVESSGTCRLVIERLVESGGRPTDRETEEHVGSCMSCFRAMNDLRDVPRVSDALRAAEPAQPQLDNTFWEALARRTTDAAAAALSGESVAPSPVPAAPIPRRRVARRARIVSFGALAVAAAAGWAFMARHPAAPGPEAMAPGAAVALAAGRMAGEDGSGEAVGDVAELDASALRALLDRLGRHAPPALASGTTDEADPADVPSDDEPRVTDAVADLDGEGLRRVAVSLAGASL